MMAVANGFLRLAMLAALIGVALGGCGTYGIGPRPSVPASDLYKIVQAKQP